MAFLRPKFVVVVALAIASLFALAAHADDAVHVEGRVVLVHGDDLRNKRAVGERVYLQSDSGLLPLPASAARFGGQSVVARGTRSGGRIVLTGVAAADGSGSTTGTTAPASMAVFGVKRVAVILFNFSDDMSQPFTRAAVNETYFATGTSDRSVANYFNEVSWGQIQLTGQVVGWYTIAASTKTCDPGTWATQADQAAQAAGVDLSAYDYRTYVYPGVPSCGWGGLAQMPGNRNWINGSPTVGIMAHELGHNVGLNHAVSASCTLENGERVAFGPNCTTTEYGDQYDVMGMAGMTHHVNEWHRAMLGFIDDIQTVSADGTYTLAPVESLSGAPHSLRIPRGDGTSFSLEYRRPYGIFDAFPLTAPAVNGVMIRRVSGYSIANKPELLDTTPETPSYADAPLAAERTFADPTTGITVTTVSLSATSAQVAIRVRPGGDFTPPNVAISGLSDGASVTLPTNIAVAATDNVGVAKVELYRQKVGEDPAPGVLYGTDTTAPFSFPWVDGQNGQYAFTAVAYDTSGISSVSRTVTVTASQSDAASPSTPADLRATANTQTTVATAWAASTDNVGVVSYRVFLNGVVKGTTSTTAFTFTGLTCGGSYTVGVAALDAAGNSSPRAGLSAWTTACTGDLQAPSMPSEVQAAVTGATSIRLAWQASSDNVGVAGYRIDRNGATVAKTTATSFNDGGLVSGQTYSYTVTAYDAAWNNSGTSDPIRVTVTYAGDTQAPSPPAGVQVSAVTASTVALSWQASVDDVGVTGYRVFRNGSPVGQSASPGFVDSGLAAGTTYTYTVAAYDAAGNTSASSSPVPATTTSQSGTDTEAPTPPGALEAKSLKGRKIGLTWTTASDNVGVVAYRVYRDGVSVATVTSALAYTDNPGRGGHTYHVVALDAAGNASGPSNSVTVRV